MARLFAIRHGETEWNRARRVQGHTDVPLSQVGLDQALAVAEAIAARILDPGAGRKRALVYTSDLARARDTAAPIAARLAVVPRRRLDLRERGMGVAEGKTWVELARDHPLEAVAYKSHANRDAFPGIELLAAFRARVLQAAHDIAAVADEDHAPAVVVTHGGVLHVLLEEALGHDKRFIISNTTVYTLDVLPSASGPPRIVRVVG